MYNKYPKTHIMKITRTLYMTLTVHLQSCFANITTLLDKDPSLTRLLTNKERPKDGSGREEPLCLETNSFEIMPHKLSESNSLIQYVILLFILRFERHVLLDVEPKIQKKKFFFEFCIYRTEL